MNIKSNSIVYLTTKESDTFRFPHTHKVQIIEINENANFTCSISKNVFKEKIFI